MNVVVRERASKSFAHRQNMSQIITPLSHIVLDQPSLPSIIGLIQYAVCRFAMSQFIQRKTQ
jgi:hypothetical protein